MTKAAVPMCGIIMPISACDGMESSHWSEVKSIFEDAIEKSGFSPRIVSDAAESGIIQTRIIGNIYRDDIILCDVSGRNPNVMFELGLRIAFDKPVVILKDDVTDYAFDIGPMEHINYPRSLRYAAVEKFKTELSLKIKSTANSKNSFLKDLGPIKLPELNTTIVPAQELILDEMKYVRRAIVELQNAREGNSANFVGSRPAVPNSTIKISSVISLKGWNEDDVVGIIKILDAMDVISSIDEENSLLRVQGSRSDIMTIRQLVSNRSAAKERHLSPKRPI